MARTSQYQSTQAQAYLAAMSSHSNYLAPAKPTLEGLPTELLHKIFAYLVEDEQSSLRALTGSSQDPNSTCLPFANVRPPPLIRTSRLIRHAYLHYFFANTIFRIDARVDYINFIHFWILDGRIAGIHNTRCLDRPAFAWLTTLLNTPSAPIFRHLQYRPLISEVVPLGLTVTIDFDPRARTYTISSRFDEDFRTGWNREWADWYFSGGKALWGPQNVALQLAKMCQSSNEEVLDIRVLVEFERMFRTGWMAPDERNPQLKKYAAGRLEMLEHEIQLLGQWRWVTRLTSGGCTYGGYMDFG